MISKSDAVHLFQHYGLEGLPARVLRAQDVRSPQSLSVLFPEEARFCVRSSEVGERKNLPRLIDCTVDQAYDWIHHQQTNTVIIQPYDDLIFSVELVVDGEMVVAELVPGIWELDNRAAPCTVATTDMRSYSVDTPVDPQPVKLWSSSTNTATCQWAHTDDWQIDAYIEWLQDNALSLERLRSHTSGCIGIKLHYARRYGLSPQNIRTESVLIPDLTAPTSGAMRAPLLNSPFQELPAASAVRLDVSLARESSNTLDDFARALCSKGIATVYLRSGLLSHMAIILREQGLKVHRW